MDAIVLFCKPSARPRKAIFEEYVGELSQEALKQLIAKLKGRKLYHLVLTFGFPFWIELLWNWKKKNGIYDGWCHKPVWNWARRFESRRFNLEQGPEIPVLREQLAILVSTGKTKEAIGLQLTQEQVKRLGDKDVEKYYKRYETYDCCKQGWLGCFCRLKTLKLCRIISKKIASSPKSCQSLSEILRWDMGGCSW